MSKNANFITSHKKLMQSILRYPDSFCIFASNTKNTMKETTQIKNSFDTLANNITSLQDTLSFQAVHAVNLYITARNWMIGWYIVEYEQNGLDKAQYGEQLLKKLSSRINRKGLGERILYNSRQLYTTYPYMGEIIVDFLSSNNVQLSNSILHTACAKLQHADIKNINITKQEDWQTPPERLFYKINYSSLRLISTINDPFKRAFYEQELIRGCWSYKELDRQINSLYYERMGLSTDKQALKRYVSNKSDKTAPKHIIHDPTTLEFLGLKPENVFTETKLETEILNHIQNFLLELGNGFCFEARQKRILIDQDYYKADLIFYHRILRCHVIVDLKIDRFRHEYASQLNMYLNYYKHEVSLPDDNPPIGLLLCTDYGETTVKYATEGLSNIFVTKYQLQLPSEADIKKYLLDNFTDEDFKRAKNEILNQR